MCIQYVIGYCIALHFLMKTEQFSVIILPLTSQVENV